MSTPLTHRIMVAALAATILILPAAARSVYQSPQLGFNEFMGNGNPCASLNKDRMLEDSNTGEAGSVRLAATIVPPNTPFLYYARMASPGNREGKHYVSHISHSAGNDAQGAEWGITFGYDGSNYWAVTLQCTDHNLGDDMRQTRTMRVRLAKFREGGEEPVEVAADTVITNGMNLEEGFNFIGVRAQEHEVVVLGGIKGMKELMHAKVDALPRNSSQVGYMLGPKANVIIERTALSYSISQKPELATGWTIKSLNEHFAATTDPFEGYWQYLDREMEDKWLRMGGRYTIALVKNESDSEVYDIIYIDGAKVMADKWTAGMLKGRMKPTIFTDNYDATWVDATQQEISDDVQAVFESGVILKIAFPVYKSQLRFSKVIKPAIAP